MEQRFCAHCMSPISGDLCNICKKDMREYQPAPHHLQPGTVLSGKYVVGEVLGEGGFGITYIGREVNLDIKVAIKEYFPSGVVNRNNTCSSELTVHRGDAQDFFEKGKNRFLSEARMLAKFSNEPGIVSVRDFFSENNTVYIAMEYLKGINLKDYLRQRGKMSFKQTVIMLAPVMGALSKIHAQGLIHRDISPANIMILDDGTVKLLDFGAARNVGSSDEKSLSILLKPGFAPEEQYRTKGCQGPWTDVYALSATMYKMMTGITPVDAMNRIFFDDLKKITEFNPAVTPEQEAVIFKGMAVQQGDRYQTIAGLSAACQAAAEGNDDRNEADHWDDERTVSVALADEKAAEAADNGRRAESRRNSLNQASRLEEVSGPEPVSASRSEAVSRHKSASCLKPESESNADGDKAVKGDKKPAKAAFAGFVITGILTLYWVLNAAAAVINEESPVRPVLIAVLFGAATFFLGRLFFFGYFYYPRLERKKKALWMRIYGGMAAVAVIAFIVNIVFMNLNTVTVGDKNIERDDTSITLFGDIITDKDLEKFREFKNLESLTINACFLDDEDVKILGELTRLKKLSLCGNTDIVDVSPLNNLVNLTNLDISITGAEDISCLDKLVNLETLNISRTKVGDLSVLSRYTKLDTLKMSSVDGLDISTAALPETVRTLYCDNNGLESLEFVSGSESLINIYAGHNRISDLTPLSKYQMYNVDLAANKIADLSLLNIQNISDLDVSSNAVTDISCLEGIPAFRLNLSHNQISDISALEGNYRIGLVDLSNNQITDIGPLKDCFKISSLYISYNQITDISPLTTIDNLERLEARGNQIADIGPLASCKMLIEKCATLDLRDNAFSDINALNAYVNTTHLYLSGNKIADASPLASCSSLEMLRLNNNQLTDVSALDTLENLRFLEVANNPLTSIHGLRLPNVGSKITGKTQLSVSYHEGIDFSDLAGAENLSLIIYDVPERQKDSLRKLGLYIFLQSEDLDKVEENGDFAQEESGEPEQKESGTEGAND